MANKLLRRAVRTREGAPFARDIGARTAVGLGVSAVLAEPVARDLMPAFVHVATETAEAVVAMPLAFSLCYAGAASVIVGFEEMGGRALLRSSGRFAGGWWGRATQWIGEHLPHLGLLSMGGTLALGAAKMLGAGDDVAQFHHGLGECGFSGGLIVFFRHLGQWAESFKPRRWLRLVPALLCLVDDTAPYAPHLDAVLQDGGAESLAAITGLGLQTYLDTHPFLRHARLLAAGLRSDGSACAHERHSLQAAHEGHA